MKWETNYLSPFFDDMRYARSIADQTGGKLYVDNSVMPWELPNESEYNFGDVLWRKDGIFALLGDKWRILHNNDSYVLKKRENINPKIEINNTTNTAEWLSLLEDKHDQM